MPVALRVRVRTLLVLGLACTVLWGCPLESTIPLSSSESAVIDRGVIGAWRCVAPESEKLAVLTIAPFDDRQYYIGAAYEGSAPSPFRAYSTTINGRRFLNIKALANVAPPFAGSWLIARYTQLHHNVLHVELVRKAKLSGDLGSEAGLRDALLAGLGDPSTFEDYAVCIRVPERPE
jgi:hypothetical protein